MIGFHQGRIPLSGLFLCLLMICALTTAAQPLSQPLEQPIVQSILAITNDDYPYQNTAIAKASTISFKLLNLDAADTLEQQLGQHLPANKALAETQIKRRIADIGQARFNQQLRDAYEPVVVAMRYGVDRYPAVIFDGKTVVYGTTDLQLALQHYIRWLTLHSGDTADE